MAADGASQPEPTPPEPDFDPRITDIDLLQRTQRYLEMLLQRQAPDALLTRAWEEFYLALYTGQDPG